VDRARRPERLPCLAARQRLLVAVDDVQWLDSPSREVLTFAAPRLESSPVRFLLSKRPGRVSPLERAFGPTGLERLEVGPLSVGATRQLLLDRLGLSLPRRLLRRLVDSTLGNPLFALEVGRTLADSSTARRTLRPDVGSRRTERWATEELDRARVDSVPIHELEAHRILGLAKLIAHEPGPAVEHLRAVWEHAERVGVEVPGVFPVAPDLVEALVELGELAEAQRVTRRLRKLSMQQEHPWGLATAKRCDGVVELATGYADEATGALEQAAAG
jgi:hypothetical protein